MNKEIEIIGFDKGINAAADYTQKVLQELVELSRGVGNEKPIKILSVLVDILPLAIRGIRLEPVDEYQQCSGQDQPDFPCGSDCPCRRKTEKTRPLNCRQRLIDEGQSYPRSSCSVCGSILLKNWKCPY